MFTFALPSTSPSSPPPKTLTLPYPAKQVGGGGLLHLDVGEELLACILQAGAKDIHLVIDDEEAVVVMLADVHRDGRILPVVLLNVKLLLLGERTGVDGGRDTSITFAEHGERCFVDIIVYQHYRPLGLLYQPHNLRVGIEDLSVVEDSFYRRKGGADKEVYLFAQFLDFQALFDHSLLNVEHSLIYCITSQQVLLQDAICPFSELSAI